MIKYILYLKEVIKVMNVVIYARYSSHNQNEQSIEGQLKICYDYAKQNNYNVIKEYIDRATTATNDHRPQFKQMIKDSSEKNFNGIIVYQLDRFARNRYDSAIYKHQLKKNNVRVFSARENISDDASGILMESVLEGLAEYYSVELSQKIIRGLNLNRENAYFNGGQIPLGLKTIEVDSKVFDSMGRPVKKKKLVIDELTAPTVKKIFELYANGEKISSIINYLNKHGKKTKTGKNFNKNNLHRILTNRKYIGIYEYNGFKTENAIPQLIDNKIFDKVQERLAVNKVAPSRQRAKTSYLLTTKLYCGYCKEMMIGYSGTSKTGRLYNYYVCKNAKLKLCNKKNVSKDYIEDIVVKKARSLLTDTNIDKIAKTVVELCIKENENSSVSILQKRVKEIEKQKNRLFDTLKLCEYDNVRKNILEEMNNLEKEKTENLNEIAHIESSHINLTIPQIKFFLENIRNGNINDIKYKKVLIQTLINKIYLYDNSVIILFNTQDKEYIEKIPSITSLECSFNGTDAPPI